MAELFKHMYHRSSSMIVRCTICDHRHPNQLLAHMHRSSSAHMVTRVNESSFHITGISTALLSG